MATGHARVAASILDADFANLAREIRRAERGGVDRFHLDVMDGHFVPNITFGPAAVRAIRRVTVLPLDVHLMISEPSGYVEEFLAGGADSITIHVEIDEAKEPTLRAIRSAGRAAGLAVSPKTPIDRVQPYVALLDIVMVMGVEPGFGGQAFIPECGAKVPQARELLADRPLGEVHIDGGVNRDNAELLGALGVDIFVAGSTLYQRGRDLGREVRLVRALADEGWAIAHGAPRVPRDRWVSLAVVGRERAEPIREELAGIGIPSLIVASADHPRSSRSEVREVLIPALAAEYVRERLPRIAGGEIEEALVGATLDGRSASGT